MKPDLANPWADVPSLMFTADLHLTARAADEYRWSIFPWIEKRLAKYDVGHLFILGDLTELKDEHPSRLVNRLVDVLSDLAAKVPITILKGNHDYIEVDEPFFRFLSRIPRLQFCNAVLGFHTLRRRILLLPHTRQYVTDWRRVDMTVYDRVLLHQTVTGAVGAGGRRLTGIGAEAFAACPLACRLIAGDIHVPQEVGRVTYVGAPYPVVFGDDYQPRVLLDGPGGITSLTRHTVKKTVAAVRHPTELKGTPLEEGDMLKVVFVLERAEYGDFARYRRRVQRWAARRGIDLHGVELRAAAEAAVRRAEPGTKAAASPAAVLRRYSAAAGVPPEMLEAGLRLVTQQP